MKRDDLKMGNISDNRLVNQEVITRFKRIWMAIVLGSLAAFGPLSIDMYLPALPNIAKGFGTSPSFVQLSLTFFILGLASGQLLTGPISDVFGPP